MNYTRPELEIGFASFLLLAFLLQIPVNAQQPWSGRPLDLARDPSSLRRPLHTPLPEQYIWTADDAAALRADHAKFTFRDRARKTEPHAFRNEFALSTLPRAATLYVAGPRSVKVWLNGKLVLDGAADAKSPLNTHVFSAEVHSALRTGRNLIAVEAVRGPGIVAASDSPVVQQLAYGESLVVKIVPTAPGHASGSIVITDSSWRSTVNPADHWQEPSFDDRSWPRVQSLGSIESSPEFFQWNTDAGMYDWPGYMGMSPYLRTYTVFPSSITHRSGALLHIDSLMQADANESFTVRIPEEPSSNVESPALLLDFGREVSGRLLIASACDCEAKVLASYGESEGEALSGGHYLGTNLLRVAPQGEARGPKSGFRYVWLKFVGGAPQTTFRAIRVEGIAYPVHYLGSFTSSDPTLNRIWETAAYTAHLCMQDDLWDAPKRDRGRWAGDLDAMTPVIEDVFADSTLLSTTLTRLIPPAGQDVNGIPGYTALWITALAQLYRHNGDQIALEKKHTVLLRLLGQIDTEVSGSRGFTNKNHRWLFVDWAPNLFAYTPEAILGTELEFVRAYRDGAWLLDQLGDHPSAIAYNARAESLAALARSQLQEDDHSWQLNAMAILAGVTRESDYPAIWDRAFASVSNDPQSQTISPYFNFYLLRAMVRAGHPHEALDWLRRYWGGMLTEGATSFWESYDLRWPKENPHLSLQADGTSGYFVSLAHGWSSGPAAWLEEEILGIQSTAPGFRTAEIHPDLMGLHWARGAVPTPRGLIRIDVTENHIALYVPAETTATLLLPVGNWTQNGKTVHAESAEHGSRMRVVLRTSGQFEFERHP